MGVCLLIATGLKFPVDKFLKGSPFKPMNVLRKGEIAPGDPQRRPRLESSFVVLVSQDEEKGLSRQFAAAMQFLLRYKKELSRLRKAGVDTLLFNFGYAPPDQARSEVYLPPALITAMAKLDMGIIHTTLKLPPV